MKRKLLYPLIIISASLTTGPALSVPLAPVSVVTAVSAEQPEEETDRGESSLAGALSNGRQTAIADQTALLLEIRESGKQQAARAAFDLAALSFKDNDLGRTDQLLREAVALQPENSNYLLAASRLAFRLKDYEYAETCLVTIRGIYRSAPVEDGAKLLIALDDLATLYRIQGKTAAAKTALIESLAVKKAVYGEHNPKVIQNLYRLAELDLAAANYGEARHHLNRAVSLLDTSEPPINEKQAAALLHNIGELYRVSGQYAEAENAYTKAMALWNKSPATNQRWIALTQAGLDRLSINPSKPSPNASVEIAPQIENAPPVSSLESESSQENM